MKYCVPVPFHVDVKDEPDMQKVKTLPLGAFQVKISAFWED
jgi:hypothetical protein